MALFYLLPPRPYLGDCLASYLASWFPGLAWPRGRELADLVDTMASREEVYVVHREDLPDDPDTARALIDGYGAGPGDEVIEVRTGGKAGELVAERWRLP